MNLPALVRSMARAEGIPEALLPAVVHRAEMARRAVRNFGGRRLPTDSDIALRVVARSVLDHQLGVLERLVV